MAEFGCPHCGKTLESMAGAAFCPYCGGAVEAAQPPKPEQEEVLEALRKAEGIQDPKKRWQALQEIQARHPESLAIARELLFLGRLHERSPRDVDFSVIKSHLWMLYLKPRELPRERQERMREEFFEHPQLQRCLELSPNPDGFLREYLIRLATEFIRLFLRGDSLYMRRFLGFAMDSRAPKLLADPVCLMLQNIRQDAQLSGRRQEQLTQALYKAFSLDMAGETQWLDAALGKAGLPVPGE